ncbi:MAG TPA: TrbI/VirB10 family protein [Candidatus Paceibacterota bacterium]|nr:TrbI/VirB10 family protein [Candidatus Paceibacterota bacterium]
MNPRNAINFVRSPIGAFIAFCLLVVVALTVANGFKRPTQQNSASIVTPAAGAETKPQIVQTIEKAMQPFNPPKPKSKPEPLAVEPPKKEPKKPELPPISLFGDTPSTETKPLSKYYAPYGRLIPCELVITIDSSTIRTPIVGLITEDIYHAGRLVIPAGTEVHGVAQIDRARERIASGKQWTLVWQDGRELPISGIALDREKNGDGEGWGITDGSAGLRGRLIKSDNLAEIKLFAASFLSGAAGALTERDQTVFGPIATPSLQNAPLKGAQDVLAAYAKQILDSIQRDGFYVRVSAGKQFYLYVTQTLDRDDATVGGSRAEGDAFNEVMPTTTGLYVPVQPTPNLSAAARAVPTQQQVKP